ncbi:MAG: hypothetical protein ACLFQJ_03290 [Campylobacterales bacterium]
MKLGRKLLLASFVSTLLLFSGCADKQNSSEVKKAKPEKVVQKELKKGNQKTKKAVDPTTGLIIDDGYDLVVGNCISCHSSALITQNKGDKATWNEMIVWMQKTQGLWPLGDMKEPIINYLAKNYGPTKASRRSNIVVEEWHQAN